jgi:hypothetical protein
MRIIKRVPTVKQQADAAYRSLDKWTKAVTTEIGRLRYDDMVSTVVADGDEPGRVYFTGVGAEGLTVILRTRADTDAPYRIERVVIGRESMTARQAALWLHKRAARDKRYLS